MRPRATLVPVAWERNPDDKADDQSALPLERGKRSRLEVHLAFLLPKIQAHPVFSAETIRNALEIGGAPEHRVEEHLNAVHPERRPYEGTWVLTLHDSLYEVGRKASRQDDVVHRVSIKDPAIGSRTRLSLCLRHEMELDGYFRLSFLTARGDAFLSKQETYGAGSS